MTLEQNLDVPPPLHNTTEPPSTATEVNSMTPDRLLWTRSLRLTSHKPRISDSSIHFQTDENQTNCRPWFPEQPPVGSSRSGLIPPNELWPVLSNVGDVGGYPADQFSHFLFLMAESRTQILHTVCVATGWCSPKRCIEVLAPCISECDFIWKWGSLHVNLVQMKSSGQECGGL